MKSFKFSLLAVCALFAFSASQLDAQTISNHADVITVDVGSGLACAGGGIAADNSYFQVFDLAAQGVVGDYTVGSVLVGMDAAQAVGNLDGEIPAQVFFYWTNPLNAISVDVAGPVGAIPDASCDTFIPVPLDGTAINEEVVAMDCTGVTIPGSASMLVVQVFYPGTGVDPTNTDVIFHGGNASGPAGFLASATCGLTTPTDPAAIGFPASNFLIAIEEGMEKGCTNPLGDVNLDGIVSLLDVTPFVNLLTGGDFQCEGDVNEDGIVSLLDVTPFVNLLSGG